jgi:hypothetical protein
VKVWIYKGDILPYKVSIDDKITREAAMAVGETSGQGRPRRLITAGGGRRRAGLGAPGSGAAELAAEELAAEEEALFDAEETPAANGHVADEGLVETEEPTTAASPAPETVGEEAAGEEAARGETEEEGEAPAAPPVSDLIAPPPVPDDLERQLAEDEEMERRSRHDHHEAPHFRREVD